MDKKEVERKIFELVYEIERYEQIADSERPDFRIKNKGFNSYFGVEITEFYFSASNARLRKIPNYFSEIFDNSQYRHKDDKKILEVVEFELFAPDGTSKGKERGIFQELPQPHEYSEMIINSILGKEQKLNEYAQDLTHINLIVFDTEHRLQTLPVADFYKTFFVSKLSKILFETNFREIYLITVLDKERKVYIPLKMMSLLANFYLFAELISEYPLENLPQNGRDSDNSSENIVDIFAHYMKTKTNNILLASESEQKEVIFGNCGLIFENKGIIIRDHMDYPLPKNAQNVVENEITEFFKSDEFTEKEKEFTSKYVFLTELAFDTKGGWEF